MTPERARWASAVLLWALAAPLPAAEQVILIGGGYNSGNSEAQIEQNVDWAAAVLRRLPGRRELRIYFTDGLNAGYDVKELRPLPEREFEPLSRLYEYGRRQLFILRNHRIADVAGGTARPALDAALRADFRRLRAGDQLLVVFNGHGTPAKRGREPHRLWLWNETWLDVSGMEKLLSFVPEGVTARFVLTQCYAGGFARIIHPAAADTLHLARGERCGFMAVAADQPSEGCSPSLDVGSYRDYSTYFFAALAGRARDGRPLARHPDIDGDRRVTPYDAHLYALTVARSSDVPRSTSEDFLERWHERRPFWSRSGEGPVVTGNLYGRLAIGLAQHEGFDIRAPEYSTAWRARRQSLVRSQREHRRDIRRLELRIKRLRADMISELERQEPRLGRMAEEFNGDLTPALRRGIDRVRRHPDYPRLVTLQDREDRLVESLIAIDRRIAQLDRIDRLRKLSRWLGQFETSATAEDRASYGRLLRCEKRPIGGQ